MIDARRAPTTSDTSLTMIRAASSSWTVRPRVSLML